MTQQARQWATYADVPWRGRPAKYWVRLLRMHLVGSIPVEELLIREGVSEGDFNDAMALLRDHGEVVFERDYPSQFSQLRARLNKLQTIVDHKRAIVARLNADIAAAEEGGA